MGGPIAFSAGDALLAARLQYVSWRVKSGEPGPLSGQG
jgi:hypothetical protein